MADNATPKTEPRNQRKRWKQPSFRDGMISKLKPLSSEFYTQLS